MESPPQSPRLQCWVQSCSRTQSEQGRDGIPRQKSLILAALGVTLGAPFRNNQVGVTGGMGEGHPYFRNFPGDSNLHPQPRGPGLERVQDLSESLLCSLVVTHFQLGPGGAGYCPQPARHTLCASFRLCSFHETLSGALPGLSAGATEGLKLDFSDCCFRTFAIFACLLIAEGLQI